jgi:tetratricopeptide (TPR) repeat protein
LPKAKQTLVDAVALSPHAVRRLRKLGRLAMEVGDVDTALASFQEVIGKVRHSKFRNPEDYVHLVQALLGKGNVQQASTIVRELGKSLSDFKKTEACGAISAALVHEFKSETEAVMERLAAAVAASSDAGLSNEIKMVLAQSCLSNGMEDSAAEVMLDVMNNATDDAAMAKAIAVLEKAGRTDLSLSLAQESRQQVADLTAACNDRIGQGDYQGAVELMTQAVDKMSNNPEVVLNAAATVLACIEKTGWSDELGSQAHWHIENARRLDPANPRLEPLSKQYRATLKNYSIPFERMSGKARMR